ncbi:MAG: hypothetical protein ACI96M_002651, partial [Candidatus Azotimanducaceae bacterium]
NHYSPERKEAILKKLLPPHNRTVTEVSASDGYQRQRCIIGETKPN